MTKLPIYKLLVLRGDLVPQQENNTVVYTPPKDKEQSPVDYIKECAWFAHNPMPIKLVQDTLKSFMYSNRIISQQLYTLFLYKLKYSGWNIADYPKMTSTPHNRMIKNKFLSNGYKYFKKLDSIHMEQFVILLWELCKEGIYNGYTET